MPICAPHHVKHSLDTLDGNGSMEQIAHQIDEDRSWIFPAQRQLHYVLVHRYPKTTGVVRLPHGVQPFCHAFGIAVFTSGTDLRASGNWIPR